ncbi:MAG TPA: CotH kinase family protein [Saprospiraceae bacterium]|nr:CotH kinase family protein [Saprospiraceae bacterium]
MSKLICSSLFLMNVVVCLSQNIGTSVFDNTYLHQIHLNADGLEAILKWNDPGYYEDPIMVTIDGKTVDSVYITRKGYTSNDNNNSNPPFKLDIDFFVENNQLDGLDKINLHNQLVDHDTYQRNALAYFLYNRAGIAAPRTAFAEVYLNGKFIDIYTITEDIDKSFLKQNFANNDGSLYKGVEWPPNGVSVNKGTIDAFSNYIENVNATNWNKYADLINFFKVVTIDQLIFDDIGGQNNFMYFEPISEKMYFIPWDKNLSFVGNPTTMINDSDINDPIVPFLTGKSADLINDPLIKTQYLTTVCNLLSYLIDSTVNMNEIYKNYNVLKSNNNGAIINDPINLYTFLKEASDAYKNVLALMDYENCEEINAAPIISMGDLVINEFVSKVDNNGILNPSGIASDWIELYNNSNHDITLNEHFYLSNDIQFQKKWHFEKDTVINANDYMIIWADKEVNQQGNHTSFKLDGDGGTLLLVYEDLTVIQEIKYNKQQSNKGFARIPNGVGNFVIKPATFNANNDISTSINQIAPSDKFYIYPNPSNGIFKLNGIDHNYNDFVSVYDLFGRHLLSVKYDNGLDLQCLPPAIYILTYPYNSILHFNKIYIFND